MKKLLFIIACLLTINASAQLGLIADGARVLRQSTNGGNRSTDKIEYQVDTLHYYGHNILKQRYNSKKLYDIVTNNGLDRKRASSILCAQSQMDELCDRVLKNKTLGWELDRAENCINDIKKNNPSFDLALFQNEYSFYRNYKDTFGNAELDRWHAANVAERLAQQKATEAYEAERKYKQWQADSAYAVREAAARIKDSLDDIQAAKDQKVFEARVKKKYGPKYGKAIIEQNVMLGMNKEMCDLAWGSDHYTTKKTTKTGTTETWTYSFRRYIVFTNGVVTTVSE